MDYFNPAEAFKAGYAATEAVSTDIQSKDILQQAYAAAPNTGSPQGDASVYNKAAQMAGMQGNASLAHTFQKQAGELSTSINKQKLDSITASQSALEFATQQLPLATSTEELNGIIDSTGIDPALALKLRGAIKNLPLDQAKALLKKVGTSVDTELKTQKLTLDGVLAQSRLANTAADNLRADKTAALARINASASLGQAPLYEDVALAYGKEYADKLAGGAPATGGGTDASSTGRGAAESGDNYSAVNPKSGAMGRYQITSPTLASLRKLDPSLPKTDAEFLKDPAAQDKAMKLLESEDKKSLKADGFKDSKVNLATYHRFGAGDGKKVLSAFEDNPSTPLKEALGEDKYNKIVEQNPDLVGKTVGQAIVQNYGTGSKAAEGKTMPVLKKAGTGLPAERAGNILEATLQASKDLINVTKLPEATTLNTFAGLSGKDSKGIVSGLEGAFARQVTTGDQRAFEQLIAGLESTMATAVGGGFASAASKAKMEQYAKQIPRAGDNAESAAIFLARMKQELQTVRDGFVDRQGANKEQVAKMDQAIKELDKAIPFTIDQVMEAKAKRAGGKTMGAKAAKTYGGGSTSAADEAAAAGF